ncbi:ImmA/IrrE family metallo-endopeptidase [Bacillus haynesii]|uniref:ImmA/IrrE family metallo-endopeptidase n=1 Tax=Bacillus haynesii TaxID=1925021 RepID=UPI00227D9DB3|nr:ImmA/IrrE family metallo-endopeptidase [Bacillus haynesii]MCY8045736.1 ImmA/IrrE family metallo-endopeptidase [Bacillus haynesii]MCY8080510.1 ImmA/IrrE family metallo-endopeptidase [Bacillus haynesii]MCY8384878.1 ImmA/IrrE family metallo-endopeptidase [Bacillus haynesii]MCY8590271.1 ImmA/IrrE family metallo-endopeptidase [Bacillus haynesii]
MSIYDIIDAFQSKDGYTIYDGVNHTIAYNDTIMVPERIRFTLMHEIGHIYMNHLIELEETILRRSEMTEAKYKILENEANSFARNVLAPVALVRHLNIQIEEDIVAYFKISKRAAKVRLQSLNFDLYNTFMPMIHLQLKFFKEFINRIKNLKFCQSCNHTFTNGIASHCPICGNNKLINKKGEPDLIYNGYTLDNNGRALICPTCENEQIHYDGNICKICNTYLVNKCASTYQQDDTGYVFSQKSCETILDGNARYCIKCGNESTFFQQGLLKNWREEKEQYHNSKNAFPFTVDHSKF